MKYYTFYISPVGKIMIAGDGDYITGLWIENQKYYAAGIDKNAQYSPNLNLFQCAGCWLDEYFSGVAMDNYDIPIRPTGSDFQRRVWHILRTVPYGRTITYGTIANELTKGTGRAASPRAVGGAVGRNPISIIIPCHRVIGANKALTGYAGGLDVKSKLLGLENIKL